MDKNRQIIETGIETGSPRMIEKFMSGKVKPFKAEQWQDLVEQSIGILNDNGWVVCGTMITGLPGEKDEDVIESIKLLKKLETYDCFIFVLPFISMGGLRKENSSPLDEYLNNPLRRELLKEGTKKSIKTALSVRKEILKGVKFPRNLFLTILMSFAFSYLKRKLS